MASYTFDTATRTIIPDAAPVSGRVTVDVQDMYSRMKDYWLANSGHTKFRIPMLALGGQTTAIGVLGTTYFLQNGWHLIPRDDVGAHTLQVEGNLITDDGSDAVTPVAGVSVVGVVSTLVEVRQLYEQALEDIRKVLLNAFETDPVAGIMKIYEDDDSTVAFQADIWEDIAKTQQYRGRGIERRDKLQ